MNSNFSTAFQVFYKLLQRDWYTYRQAYPHRLKMALDWVLLVTLVSKLFMPALGLKDYGAFILITSAISYGLFIAMQNAIAMVDDITSHQAILYKLSLPIPQWAIFLKYAFSNMLQALLIMIGIMPFGMCVLMDIHAFPDFSCWKFIMIFLIAAIFYGAFSLIFSTILKNLYQIDNVWLRLIFPMWYLGGWQFSWKTLYNVSPTLAYLDFCNPMLFVFEAAKHATIDISGTLPFGFCCCMILFYAAIFGTLGICWMKKRLDCL